MVLEDHNRIHFLCRFNEIILSKDSAQFLKLSLINVIYY